jgi:hypothetical protein
MEAMFQRAVDEFAHPMAEEVLNTLHPGGLLTGSEWDSRSFKRPLYQKVNLTMMSFKINPVSAAFAQFVAIS